MPPRSAGYETIHVAFGGVLDNVDAHSLARSEVGFATEIRVELRLSYVRSEAIRSQYDALLRCVLL